MSGNVGKMLILVFFIVGLFVCYMLWSFAGWRVLPQAGCVLIMATIGEHHVSGKGYYLYTPKNGIFIGRVPLWIPFMWVSVVQGALLLCLLAGFQGLAAVYVSGLICSLADFLFIEPYLCSRENFWEWKTVEGGYFDFIPDNLNRFTAPPGNYIAWFAFPFILNAALYISNILSQFYPIF